LYDDHQYQMYVLTHLYVLQRSLEIPITLLPISKTEKSLMEQDSTNSLDLSWSTSTKSVSSLFPSLFELSDSVYEMQLLYQMDLREEEEQLQSNDDKPVEDQERVLIDRYQSPLDSTSFVLRSEHSFHGRLLVYRTDETIKRERA